MQCYPILIYFFFNGSGTLIRIETRMNTISKGNFLLIEIKQAPENNILPLLHLNNVIICNSEGKHTTDNVLT